LSGEDPTAVSSFDELFGWEAGRYSHGMSQRPPSNHPAWPGTLSAGARPAARSRLLLIDDDAKFREAMASALVRAGHLVVQAEDGLQGAKLFRAEPADLVITALVMPNRDGLELMAELHRDWPGLPIIATSGDTRSSLYLTLAAKLGARRTLVKPIDPWALLQVVEELLAARRNPPEDR
jgi:DNA-binding NtrC family response regulator